MERGVVDRFEGDIVVIEINGVTRDFPRSILPREIKAGDSVIIDNGEVRQDCVDTIQRKTEINRLMDELFE